MGSRIHVTFSVGAGQVVITALPKMGLNETVVSLPDNLGYGPIEPLDVDLRTEFERVAFLFDVPLDVRTAVHEFWAQVTTPNVEHVLWLSRRSVQELAGSMEWISRCKEPPLVLDIGTIDFESATHEISGPTSIGVLNPDQLVAHRALDYVRRMSTAAFDADRLRWAELKRENAPLRVLDDSGLVSAPITYFDGLLLACASDHWLPSVRVIGDAIARLVLEDPYCQVRDHVVLGRFRRLVNDGILEAEGDFSVGLGQTRVRRPPAQ